jgi:hypothetical protein
MECYTQAILVLPSGSMGALAGPGGGWQPAAPSLASDLSIPSPGDPSSMLEAATERHRSASSSICAAGLWRSDLLPLLMVSDVVHRGGSAQLPAGHYVRLTWRVVRIPLPTGGGPRDALVVNQPRSAELGASRSAWCCIHGGTEWGEEVAGESWSWFLNLGKDDVRGWHFPS